MRSWAHLCTSLFAVTKFRIHPRGISRARDILYIGTRNSRAIEKINARVARRRKADGNSRGARRTTFLCYNGTARQNKYTFIRGNSRMSSG